MKSLTTSYETLLVDEPRPGVVVITLNRPERRNAMTSTMFGELEHAAEAFDGEDDCRVVVLTGAGAAFCAASSYVFHRASMASFSALAYWPICFF